MLALGLGLLTLFARKQMRADEPMLDLPLFAQPAIPAGMVMAMVARDLTAVQGEAVIAAGKAAFSATHSGLLLTAAALIGALAALVFFLLPKVRDRVVSHH